MSKKKIKEPKLIIGIIILLISNIIVKIIGVLFKIPLHNLLGDQGMSYFNISYTIFTTLYLVSTAGMPTAIAIMISKANIKGKKLEVKRIFSTALGIFLLIGLVGTSLMFFGAESIANLVKAPDAALAIAVISPTLFFICIASSVRGYFQGFQNMFPTAASEVIESTGKFALGVVFGGFAFKQGYPIEKCAAYAIAGVTIGVAAGMIFLLCAKFLRRQDTEDIGDTDYTVNSRKKILRSLLSISIPIMLSSVTLNLTSTIDTFTIINLMNNYSTPDFAEAAYGNYTTLAVTMFHLPSAFIYPISTSLAPVLSAAREYGNKKREQAAIHASLKIAVIISIPCAIGMAVLSKPILSILFKNPDSVSSAAPLLSLLTPAIFFSAILTVTSAILQSCNHQKKPIISMLCGVAAKLIFSCILLSIPEIGIMGAPIGTVISYMIMAFTNLMFVVKYIGFKINFLGLITKPLISSLIASLATVGTFYLISLTKHTVVATVVSVIVTALIYFILLFVFKNFTKDDILVLPKGKKLYVFICKLGLLKEESCTDDNINLDKMSDDFSDTGIFENRDFKDE